MKDKRATSNILKISLVGSVLLALVGCASESRQAITPEKVESYQTAYNGTKTTLVVGAFQNQSDYLKGLFSASKDQLGSQAKTILKTHLQQTNRFKVVDRENLTLNESESRLLGKKQNITGARYTITGDVTEFGRKVTGDHQLFGILGSSKKQVAYAKVSLNVIDVLSSEIVYSTQGGGEYALSNREVIGFGGSAGYDSTLNGKVLNFAITEAVNQMVRDLDNRTWNIQ